MQVNIFLNVSLDHKKEQRLRTLVIEVHMAIKIDTPRSYRKLVHFVGYEVNRYYFLLRKAFPNHYVTITECDFFFCFTAVRTLVLQDVIHFAQLHFQIIYFCFMLCYTIFSNFLVHTMICAPEKNFCSSLNLLV